VRLSRRASSRIQPLKRARTAGVCTELGRRAPCTETRSNDPELARAMSAAITNRWGSQGREQRRGVPSVAMSCDRTQHQQGTRRELCSRETDRDDNRGIDPERGRSASVGIRVIDDQPGSAVATGMNRSPRCFAVWNPPSSTSRYNRGVHSSPRTPSQLSDQQQVGWPGRRRSAPGDLETDESAAWNHYTTEIDSRSRGPSRARQSWWSSASWASARHPRSSSARSGPGGRVPCVASFASGGRRRARGRAFTAPT
jgi:hypothetical protein